MVVQRYRSPVLAQITTLLLTGGEIHDSRGCGDEIEEALRGAGNFDVTRVHDGLSVLEAPNLDPFDVVVFYWTRGDITDMQRDGLLNWIASGKGFAGIHSATASFRECPEYHSMLGGIFTTHPPPRKYRVSIVDPEHPITKGMREFFVEDEQYIMDYDPRVNVLASALWEGEEIPVVWTKSWAEGRVFYLALGHDPEACRNENFKMLLERGTLWAAGRQ